MEFGGVRHEGEVYEHGLPSVFDVTCLSLSQCTVCGTATTADNQIFCSICSRPAHRQSLFFPDSFQCQKCGDIVCRKHTVHIGSQLACTRCAKGGRPLRPRWLRHCLFGLAASTLSGMLTAIVAGYLVDSGADITGPAILGAFAIGLVLALAAWTPFLCMIMQPYILRRHKVLSYKKIRAEVVQARKPDWLYGNLS